nr:copia protein [Tanacetum cinerariifolium]
MDDQVARKQERKKICKVSYTGYAFNLSVFPFLRLGSWGFDSFIHPTPWKGLIPLLKGSIENPDFLSLTRVIVAAKIGGILASGVMRAVTDYVYKRCAPYSLSKDLDLWHVITNGDFQPIVQNPETKLDEKTLLITHQGKNQVKDNKIDLLVRQYEQFVISEDDSIDSAFARFNTIITNLKALDEGYSSKNYVRKFLKAIHLTRRAKVTAIEESKDLTSLSLDELTRNLKVHEMILKKDSEIVKAKVERKSLVLKAKKESSDEECSTSGSEDEEYTMALRQKNDKSERKCFRRGDPNHVIGECPKPPRDKNQRAFVGGFLSDKGEENDEKIRDETCLVAQAPMRKVKESLNVTFDETPPPSKTSPLVDDDLDEEKAIKVTEKKNLENDIVDQTLEIDEIVNVKESRNHPLKNVIGNLNQRTLRNMTIIGTKWVFRNKLDENGIVSRNKARPDIMFSVCLCARFQEGPKTSHLEAVKRIFRYIKGTTHLGLWYHKGTGIKTVVYADSDHAGDYVNRKSTSGICTFVGCCLTSWFSKKQTALAISTTEAKYVSTGKACQQALWMEKALIDYDVRFDDVPIMCDNKGVIELSKKSVQYSRTKHIEIHHHFLCDNAQKGHISIEKVSSVNNIADILTNPLNVNRLTIYVLV